MADQRNNSKYWIHPNEACLKVEDLEALLSSEMEDNAQAQKRAHLMQCPRCTAELALLRSFEDAAPNAAETKDVDWITARLRVRSHEVFGATPTGSKVRSAASVALQKPGGFLSRWRNAISLWKPVYAWSAVALLLLGIATPLLLDRLGEPRLPSTIPQTDQLRSATLTAESPNGDVEAVPERLMWNKVEGAIRYEVLILEVDHTELWKSETTQAGIALPEQIRAMLVPGKKVIWQVLAIDAAGRALASSGNISFRVVRPRSEKPR